jgi:hypothetical protein
LLAEDFISKQQKLYDYYAGMFPEFKIFQNIFNQLTEDYGNMVICNSFSCHDFFNKVFWYKAVLIGNHGQNSTNEQNKCDMTRLCISNSYDDNYDNINKFDIDNMIENPNICIIAKRGSGKSYQVCEILNKYGEEVIKNSLIISPTEKMNSFYSDKYPGINISYTYTPELINSYLNDTKGVIVLDDCLYAIGSWSKDESLMKMLHYGKYYNKTIITVIQYPLGIKQEIRDKFDYVILFGEDYYSNQKRLYEHYVGMFHNFNTFRNVFVDVTNDFGSMVISRHGKKLIDRVFRHKVVLTNDKQLDIIDQFLISSKEKHEEKETSDTSSEDLTVYVDNTIQLRRFDINNLCENPQILIIGKRGTGKTCQVQDILDQYDDDIMKNSLIITPKNCPKYSKYQNAKITNEYNSDLIKSYLNNVPGIIVLDNCLISNGSRAIDPIMMELLFNGRHYNKTVIVAMPCHYCIQLELRSNFDYVFVFGEDFYRRQQSLYKFYASMFPDFKTFRNVFVNITVDYCSMVISKRGKHFNDRFFWYKATVINNDKEEKLTQIPIKKFKLEEMVANPSICMVVKRGSGKNYLLNNILIKDNKQI